MTMTFDRFNVFVVLKFVLGNIWVSQETKLTVTRPVINYALLSVTTRSRPALFPDLSLFPESEKATAVSTQIPDSRFPVQTLVYKYSGISIPQTKSCFPWICFGQMFIPRCLELQISNQIQFP